MLPIARACQYTAQTATSLAKTDHIMANGDSSLQDTLAAIDALNQSSFESNDHARAQALISARALCKRLEKPWDSIFRMFWMEVSDQISGLSSTTADNYLAVQ